MRYSWSAATVALLLTGLSGCKDTQPALVGPQTAAVTVAGLSQNVQQYKLWERWLDQNADGIPDLYAFTCEVANSTTSARVPWSLAGEVTVFRAGSTVPEVVLTTLTGSNEFSNISPYDTASEPIANLPADAGGEYRNGRLISGANLLAFQYCNAPKPDPLPEENFAGLPWPIEVKLNPGDTIVVAVRKQTTVQSPFNGIFTSPQLQGGISVGGSTVAAAGKSDTSAADGDGMTFSYTLR